MLHRAAEQETLRPCHAPYQGVLRTPDNIPILRSRKLRHKGPRVWEPVKVKWLVDPDTCVQTADFICTGTVRREVSPPSQGAGRVS